MEQVQSRYKFALSEYHITRREYLFSLICAYLPHLSTQVSRTRS